MTDQTDDNQKVIRTEPHQFGPEHKYFNGGAPQDMPNTPQDPNDKEHGAPATSVTSEVIVPPVSEQAKTNDGLTGFIRPSDHTPQTVPPSPQSTTTMASIGDANRPESDNGKVDASVPTSGTNPRPQKKESDDINMNGTDITQAFDTPSTKALQQYPIGHEPTVETSESARLNTNFESQCRDQPVHSEAPTLANDNSRKDEATAPIPSAEDAEHVTASEAETEEDKWKTPPSSPGSNSRSNSRLAMDPKEMRTYARANRGGSVVKDAWQEEGGNEGSAVSDDIETDEKPLDYDRTAQWRKKAKKKRPEQGLPVSDGWGMPLPIKTWGEDVKPSPDLVGRDPVGRGSRGAKKEQSINNAARDATDAWDGCGESLAAKKEQSVNNAAKDTMVGRGGLDGWGAPLAVKREQSVNNAAKDTVGGLDVWGAPLAVKKEQSVNNAARDATDAWDGCGESLAAKKEQSVNNAAKDTMVGRGGLDGWGAPLAVKREQSVNNAAKDTVGGLDVWGAPLVVKKEQSVNNAAKDTTGGQDVWGAPLAAKKEQSVNNAAKDTTGGRDGFAVKKEQSVNNTARDTIGGRDRWAGGWAETLGGNERSVNNAASDTMGGQDRWGSPPAVKKEWGSEYEITDAWVGKPPVANERTDTRVENTMHPSVGRYSRTGEIGKIKESSANDYNGDKASNSKSRSSWPKSHKRRTKSDNEDEINESVSVGGSSNVSTAETKDSKELKGAGGKREFLTGNANEMKVGRRYDDLLHQEKNIKNPDSRSFVENATSFVSYESKDGHSRLDNVTDNTWSGSDTVKSNRLLNIKAAPFVLSAEFNSESAYSPKDELSKSGVFVPQADGYGATPNISNVNNNFAKSRPGTTDTINATAAWQQTQLRNHVHASYPRLATTSSTYPQYPALGRDREHPEGPWQDAEPSQFQSSSSAPPTATLPNVGSKRGSMDSMWARKDNNGNSTSTSLDNSNNNKQVASPLKKGPTTGGASTGSRKNSLTLPFTSGGEFGYGRTGTSRNDRSATGITVTSPDKYDAEHYPEHMDLQGYSPSSAPNPTRQPVSPATGHNLPASHPHRHSGSVSVATESANALVSSSISGGQVSQQISCFYCGAANHVLSRDCPFIPITIPKIAWSNLLNADKMQDTQEFSRAFDTFTKACPTETFQDIEKRLIEYKCNFHLVAFDRELPPNKKLVDLQGRSGYRYPIAIIFLGDNGGSNNEPISSAPVFSPLRRQPGVPITDEQNMLWLADGGFPRDPREVPMCRCCGKKGHWTCVCTDDKF